jgi:hypothetical protein
MTNFEKLTATLMQLFIDLQIGISLPLRKMLSTLTACLLEGTPAHLTALAEALPDIDTAQVAKEQRIRRFLSNPHLSPIQLLPVFIHILHPLLMLFPALVLSLDRTCWKKRKRHINILMVSVAFRGRAIPLYWIVKDRAGNSSLSEWKQVLTPVITHLQAHPGFSTKPLIVVADREFASPKLAEWLHTTYHVESVLRLKRSAYLCDQEPSVQLAELLQYFPQGETQAYHHITVTQTSTFLVHVVITWGTQYEEPLIIMSTSEEANTSIRWYRQRFGIEPMFKDQKSNGFDLEHTKVTDPKRIDTLLLVMAFAHVLCTSEGYRRECSGVAKKNAFTADSFDRSVYS